MPTTFFTEKLPIDRQKEQNERTKLLNDYLSARAVAFNPKDSGHIKLINDCNLQVTCKLAQLQTIDKRIILGLAIGFAAIALSYLFPLSLVGMAAFAYSAYLSGQRVEAAQQYDHALRNLVGCAEWSLNDVSWGIQKGTLFSSGNQDGANQCTPVQQMLATLTPLMTKKELKAIIDDRTEEQMINAAENTAGNARIPGLTELRRPLNQEERHVYHGIYGFGMGKPQHIAMGLWYLAGQAAGKAKTAIVARWNRSAEAAATTALSDDAAAAPSQRH